MSEAVLPMLRRLAADVAACPSSSELAEKWGAEDLAPIREFELREWSLDAPWGFVELDLDAHDLPDLVAVREAFEDIEEMFSTGPDYVSYVQLIRGDDAHATLIFTVIDDEVTAVSIGREPATWTDA